MLNPKLIEEFGEGCVEFFNRLVEKVDKSIIDMCYAIIDLKVNSGNLCGPQWVGVNTDNSDIAWDITKKCTAISFDLRDNEDEKDVVVQCLPCSEEELRKDGIKIWV